MCVEQVRGLDVHPVAVIIARVTWLLALGPAILEAQGEIYVPVFLGDAMQWNLREVGDSRDVVVPVPDEAPLHVPAGFAEDQARFDCGIADAGAWSSGRRHGRRRSEHSLLRFEGVSARRCFSAGRRPTCICASFIETGRNGIWPFVLRNLMRPLWLSRPDQRADVLIGNPPWIAYRHLSAEMKPRLRAACQADELMGRRRDWRHNQDMSALFWARGAERYLRQGGTIAFVLPYRCLEPPSLRWSAERQFWQRAGAHRRGVGSRPRTADLRRRHGTTSSCVVVWPAGGGNAAARLRSSGSPAR